MVARSSYFMPSQERARWFPEWKATVATKKTQEARSLVGTNKQAPFKCLPSLIMLALGETIDHSPVPVWISSGESLLDYSQDIPNEMQGASNQHLVQSHRQIQTCVSIKCEDRQVR
jgi:hypothetical protein